MAYESKTKPSSKTMTDGELCALIDHERENGIGFADQLSSDRAKAMAYYLGEASHELTPPAIDGRSKVVSKDLMEVVEAAMPSLMRMFCSADDVIRFEPEGPEDEKNTTDATEYCGWVLFRKNNGFMVLHDAIKSALISRMGVVKVYCEEAWDERETHYAGLDDLDLQALQADDTIEVAEIEEVLPVEVQVVNGQPGQPQTQQPTYNVMAKIKTKKHNIVVEGVPPEEIWFSKDSREIDKLRCIGQNTPRTVSDLISLGYDPDKVAEIPTGDDEGDTYGERLERESYDGSYTYDDDADTADPSQRVVILQLVYIKVDYDGDGISEYRRIVKAGNVVFENEIVQDHEFALACPNLMPYKLIGLSLWDQVEDLQRINTAITRQYLDNLYLANNPQKVVVAGEVNLDDLLNPRPGGLIRANSPDAIRELTTTDIGPQAQAAIQYFTGVRDNRTGIRQFSQGLVGEELSKSQVGSEGVAMLQDQADQRLELIARVLAETFIARIYRLILKNATQYPDRQAQMRVNGEWLQIDPQAWKENYAMSVSIGIGTSSKAKQIQNAQMLIAIQQQAAQYGLVQPQNGYNALEDLLAAMGKKDVSRYFTPPQGPPPQAPDPNAAAMAKVQAESQAKMAELQQQGQLQAQKQQGDIAVEQMKQQAQAEQSHAETQLEAQRDSLKMQNDKELAQFKAELDYKLAVVKAQMSQDTAIEVARINAEAKIASAKAMGAKDASTADQDIAYQENRE